MLSTNTTTDDELEKQRILSLTSPEQNKELGKTSTPITLYERLSTITDDELEKQRILSLTSLERDKELGKLSSEIDKKLRAMNNNSETLKDITTIGIKSLDFYGINIVKTLLISMNNNNKNAIKPFGVNGFSILNNIIYSLINIGSNKEEMHENFKNNITTYLNDVNEHLKYKKDYDLFDEFGKTWITYKLLIKWFYKLFFTFDNWYDSYNPEHKTIISFAIYTFYKIVFGNIKVQICKLVVKLVDDERGGAIILRDKLKSCVQMTILMGNASSSNNIKDVNYIDTINEKKTDLTIYAKSIERNFLIATENYYAIKYNLWIENIFTFYHNVKTAIDIETTRIDDYMHPSTKRKVIRVMLNKIMLENREITIQNLSLLIKSSDESINIDSVSYPSDYIENMKSVFACIMHLRNNYGDKDKEIYIFFLKEFGRHLSLWSVKIQEIRKKYGETNVELDKDGKPKKINSSQGDLDFINNCLVYYARVNSLITKAFQTNSDIVIALEQTITNLMNTDLDLTNEKNKSCSPVEILASFLDKIMKKTDSNSTTSNLEVLIDDSVKLFKHIRNKDVFIENYRELLGKRLLSEKSTSNEDEKNYINKLLIIQGSNYVAKVDTMVKDIVLSQNSNAEFHEHTNNEYKDIIIIKILSTNWKLALSGNIIIPEVMVKLQNYVEKWYVNGHPQTKLLWNYKCGECTVKTTYKGNKIFDIVMLPIHAVVLNCFNGHSELSFERITELSGINEAETLKRILSSFSATNPVMKTPLLIKISVDKTKTTTSVFETDIFRVNTEFSNPKRKINLPMFSLEVEEVEKNKLNDGIIEQRNLITQATIVRVMKSRKNSTHNDLVAEVIKQTCGKFDITVLIIKKNIEVLIEREYLKRDDDDRTMYTYLA